MGPRDAHEVLPGDAGEVVCLVAQEPFAAVGFAYDDYRAVTDETVAGIVRTFPAGAGPSE